MTADKIVKPWDKKIEDIEAGLWGGDRGGMMGGMMGRHGGGGGPGMGGRWDEMGMHHGMGGMGGPWHGHSGMGQSWGNSAQAGAWNDVGLEPNGNGKFSVQKIRR